MISWLPSTPHTPPPSPSRGLMLYGGSGFRGLGSSNFWVQVGQGLWRRALFQLSGLREEGLGLVDTVMLSAGCRGESVRRGFA